MNHTGSHSLLKMAEKEDQVSALQVTYLQRSYFKCLWNLEESTQT